tara:strand:- start:614 stop:742 length:129 start_codon:yes stop_codon:yes gene_type:complete
MTFDDLKKEILFHANAYKDETIDVDDFNQAVEQILSIYLKVI